ncbi:hypothetical protein HFP15_40015 [Amycolatopsis sp. K13G38]|uniref:GATA-type domain-containing protein n=1 Tax=Amycolatopsis acididurans TaxID=2724524 RepID=A0ABX1JLA5_9PSEU|nr:hypothetical protein [Amycolatopsis acididurans]NKQ59047.1 hypothetical protein [Amycolatopsis acididurans]
MSTETGDDTVIVGAERREYGRRAGGAADWCSSALCALARTRVPRGASRACALAFAIAVGAGQDIGVHEAVVCVECGDSRSADPWAPWFRSWTGEPLCGECGAVLELDGELKGFATFARELTEHGRQYREDAG